MNRETLEADFRSLAAQLLLDTEVLSDGPISASIAIVGEGPGETELRHPQRLPFVGGSGNLLWDSIRPYGLGRTGVYTTNVVKRQISLSRKGNERHIVHRDELDKWIGMLKWELEQLPNCTTIFAMGNYALEAVLGESGITNWRGSVINAELPNGRKGRVVCAFNPAYAIRELKYEPVFRMDCKKLDLVARNVFREYRIESIINPTFKEALAFIRDLERSPKPVSFDIETMNTTETVYNKSVNFYMPYKDCVTHTASLHRMGHSIRIMSGCVTAFVSRYGLTRFWHITLYTRNFRTAWRSLCRNTRRILSIKTTERNGRKEEMLIAIGFTIALTPLQPSDASRNSGKS